MPSHPGFDSSLGIFRFDAGHHTTTASFPDRDQRRPHHDTHTTERIRATSPFIAFVLLLPTYLPPPNKQISQRPSRPPKSPPISIQLSRFRFLFSFFLFLPHCTAAACIVLTYKHLFFLSFAAQIALLRFAALLSRLTVGTFLPPPQHHDDTRAQFDDASRDQVDGPGQCRRFGGRCVWA
jgi:hypothetical protein